MANIKRLKRLVVVLERVRADKKKRREFDLASWATKTPDCGTHMCIMGWGATDPVLKKQGLKLTRFSEEPFTDQSYAGLRYKGARDFAAAASFLGIYYSEAEELFSPSWYKSNTNITVPINRLKKFIAENS